MGKARARGICTGRCGHGVLHQLADEPLQLIHPGIIAAQMNDQAGCSLGA
jgi:hypothetical protein